MRTVGVMGFLALSVLAAHPAQAQVYKCKSGGSTIYSQTPCGPGAAVVQTRKGPVVDANALREQRADVFRSVDANNAGYAEQRCLRAGEARAWGAANERIAQHERKIGALNRSLGRANNNVAGATWESGLRTQISGLEQAIATERNTASTLMEAERARCTAEHQRALEKIEEQYRLDNSTEDAKPIAGPADARP